MDCYGSRSFSWLKVATAGFLSEAGMFLAGILSRDQEKHFGGGSVQSSRSCQVAQYIRWLQEGMFVTPIARSRFCPSATKSILQRCERVGFRRSIQQLHGSPRLRITLTAHNDVRPGSPSRATRHLLPIAKIALILVPTTSSANASSASNPKH
jgi:hypothetical protein